jgi:hypothetical protein
MPQSAGVARMWPRQGGGEESRARILESCLHLDQKSVARIANKLKCFSLSRVPGVPDGIPGEQEDHGRESRPPCPGYMHHRPHVAKDVRNN